MAHNKYESNLKTITMTKRIYFIGLLLLAVIITSCQMNGKPDNFDYGKVENNVYSNTFFNMKMNLPSGWVVQSQEQMNNLNNAAKNLITGDDTKLKAVIKASEVNSANLLAVFQYEVGSPVDFNPNIMIVAENLKIAPGIKTGSDYLFQTRKLLKQSQLKYDELDSVFAKEVISGVDFYKMNALMKYMGLEIKQVYYSTVMHGFSLGIIISYVTDEQKAVLMKSIDSLEFKE